MEKIRKNIIKLSCVQTVSAPQYYFYKYGDWLSQFFKFGLPVVVVICIIVAHRSDVGSKKRWVMIILATIFSILSVLSWIYYFSFATLSQQNKAIVPMNVDGQYTIPCGR